MCNCDQKCFVWIIVYLIFFFVIGFHKRTDLYFDATDFAEP